MALALARQAAAQTIPTANAERPKWDIEKGASLKLIRPARFVEPDEVIFRANSAKFAKEFGVEVKVDLVGWEDITQQTAVSANTGAGPDVIIGWAESPHIYADKVLELTDVAEYLARSTAAGCSSARSTARRPRPTTGSACRWAAPAARWSIAPRPSRKPASTRSRAICRAS